MDPNGYPTGQDAFADDMTSDNVFSAKDPPRTIASCAVQSVSLFPSLHQRPIQVALRSLNRREPHTSMQSAIDPPQVPLKDYRYEKESFFFHEIKLSAGDVSRDMMHDIVTFIEGAVGPPAIRCGMVYPTLPVAYDFLDKHWALITPEMLEEAILYAQVRNADRK
jgi:hypothetical protein